MIKKLEKAINKYDKFDSSFTEIYSERLGEDRFYNLRIKLWVTSIVSLVVITAILETTINIQIEYIYLLSLLIVVFLNWLIGFIYICITGYSHFVDQKDTIKEKLHFSFRFVVAQTIFIVVMTVFFIFASFFTSWSAAMNT